MAVALDAGFDVAALLARLGVTPRRITADSRDVHPGDAFAAYPGALADGRAFIGDALSRGAGACRDSQRRNASRYGDSMRA